MENKSVEDVDVWGLSCCWTARGPKQPGPLNTGENSVWSWYPLETGEIWGSTSLQDRTLLPDPYDRHMPIFLTQSQTQDWYWWSLLDNEHIGRGWWQLLLLYQRLAPCSLGYLDRYGQARIPLVKNYSSDDLRIWTKPVTQVRIVLINEVTKRVNNKCERERRNTNEQTRRLIQGAD